MYSVLFAGSKSKNRTT